MHLYRDLLKGKGKAVALNMIFASCPDSCPLSTANLARVQKLLDDQAGRDIHFYFISIDPEHDTPEALKAYAQQFHAAPGWLFLTGLVTDMQPLSGRAPVRAIYYFGTASPLSLSNSKSSGIGL